MDRVTVDWREHRVSGYARAAMESGGSAESAYFDAPLISHVVDGLWQGGCVQDAKLDDDFDLVVSLYPWERFALGPNTERVEIQAYDSHDGMDWDDLEDAANLVENALQEGKKVLVHCQAGLNRSGLVSARALMKAGYSAQEAIDLLRNSRSPMVLCNQTFVNQLHALQKLSEQ